MALMFIGSAPRIAAKPECISPQMARQCARALTSSGSRPGLGLDLVQVFADGQRVPDLDAAVLQRGHQHGRRQQQHLGLHGRVVRRK
jgi:hypothetical protein